ncbi:MAG: MliC family protein [Opitutaceae bacterium]|jgi:membrane-bound inhibitor of C-type lysozyme|nr:MliC family protein [Opitutaceae bacterium]
MTTFKTLIGLCLVTASAVGFSSYTVGCSHAASGPVEAVYRSGQGALLAARFDRGGDRVTVRLPDGKTWVLPRARSASGARYAAGEVEFWEHQGRATLAIKSETVFEGESMTPPQDE